MDPSFHLGVRLVFIVFRRLPWWLFVGLAIAVVPLTWRAHQRHQVEIAHLETMLAMPPPATVDLALDSAKTLGDDGIEVAFRAQAIDEISGRIDQTLGSLDLSKIAIFLAPLDATSPADGAVAAVVVPEADRAKLEDWLARHTKGRGTLGPIIEVSGLRNDASSGLALTKLVNLIYPDAMKDFLIRKTVPLGEGRTTVTTDFDSDGYEALVAPLTSRFIGVTPFFEGREAALSQTSGSRLRPYHLYLALITGLLAMGYRRWRNRNAPVPQSKMVGYLDTKLRRWVTIFSAIWLVVALGSAFEIGRLGSSTVKVAIVLGVGAYMWREIDRNPKYAELQGLIARWKPAAKAEPRATEVGLNQSRAAQSLKKPVDAAPAKPSTGDFADSPIKTQKGWFR